MKDCRTVIVSLISENRTFGGSCRYKKIIKLWIMAANRTISRHAGVNIKELSCACCFNAVVISSEIAKVDLELRRYLLYVPKQVHMMLVSEQEIFRLKDFIFQLNVTQDSSVAVVVEGKRDTAALKRLGFAGKVLEFHRFGGMTRFADSMIRYRRIIILFDADRKGATLTRRTIRLLQRRTKVDLSFKKRLQRITEGKIRCIEQLACYEPYLDY